MTKKAKPKKHNAKELAAKADAALINWGIVKVVEPWRRGFAVEAWAKARPWRRGLNRGAIGGADLRIS
ncbi:hypothetical protein CASFOL_040298 [Castilleja foliolosa]|uniref:Uncharacterized protein n=1 Tax=Castilleja foliolosa TaxID=1961234 RepID=A0ABD3BFF3_9LAMI